MKENRNKNKPTARYYNNPYEDYDADDSVLRYGKLYPDVICKVKLATIEWLNKIGYSIEDIDEEDYSIYSGTSGIALLYLLVFLTRKKLNYVNKGLDVLQNCLSALNNQHVGFLHGDAGPLALGSVLHHFKGESKESKKLIERLKELSLRVLSEESRVSDDLICGRAGYLFSLLFVNKYLGEDVIEEELIKDVIAAILKSGINQACSRGMHVPLIYSWHGKIYLGAAHGLSGILFQLLQAHTYMRTTDLHNLVKPTLDYLQCLRFENGNFPSTMGSKADRLVQWCNGAPGMVDLFSLASQVLECDHYLQTAILCGEVVWKRGILTKGYGICHGAAGNAYSFLSLYNTTKNPRYLHRACKFAEWCTTYGNYQFKEPEKPFSLFEGLSGTTYFLCDLLHGPDKARFPGYAL